MVWYVYLIECVDGSLYTGIAIDVAKRYAAHISGKGARYTRSHPPQRLLTAIEYPDHSSALKAEYAIKQLSPDEKRALCLRHATTKHALFCVRPNQSEQLSAHPSSELVPPE